MTKYSLLDIETTLFLSKSKVKYVIKKMGIIPIEKTNHNKYFYSFEQVELIKENDFRNYAKNDGFVIYNSKINN